MAAQRQLVEAVEQDRQPVRTAHRGEEGVEPGLERVLAQQPLGGPLVGADPELLMGVVDQLRGPPAVSGGGRPRAGEQQGKRRRTGVRPLREEPRERLAPA